MKKISRLATLLVLSASFVTPFFVSAQFALPGDNPGTNSVTGTSAPTPGTTAAGSGTSVPGGINTGVITPYSEGIKNVINNILVPVLFAIAFIVFLWGVYKYFILGAADEKSRADGRQFVLWGIIGFVVILTVWGLVAIVSGVLGLQMGGAAPRTPTL